MRRISLETLARIWIVIGAIALAVVFSKYLDAGLTNGNGYPLGHDFINTWAGAKLAALGRTAEIYDFGAFHAFQLSVVGADIQMYHYSYSPVMAVLSLPLAALPYVPALAIWLVGGVAAFVLTLRCALPWPRALIFALATPALFISLLAGQNGAWTAALLGGGLCFLDRRPVVAGVLFGLLVFKPHLGLLIPLALAAGRKWRAFAAATATVLLLCAAGLAMFGVEGWVAYIERAEVLRAIILEDGTGVWHRMVSIFVTARRLGAGLEAAYLLQGVAALIAALSVIGVWLSSVPSQIKYSVLVVGGFLATPYLQDYDLVVATFVVAWALQQDGESEISPPNRAYVALLACLLLLPMVAASIGKLTGLAIGGGVIAAVFAYLVSVAVRARRMTTAQE